MKLYLIIGVLFASLAFAESQSDEIAAIVARLRSQPFNADVRFASNDVREAVISNIRNAGKTGGSGRDIYDDVLLLRLGDPEAMAELIKSYEDENSALGYGRFGGEDVFELSRQPLLIPLFASDFFRDDGGKIVNELEGGDLPITRCPVSIASARIVFGILRKGTDFNPEVRKWANDIYFGLYSATEEFDCERFRKDVRRWWNANRDAFEKKKYGEVKPGNVFIVQWNQQTSIKPEEASPHGDNSKSYANQPIAGQSEIWKHLNFAALGAGLAALLIGAGAIWLKSRRKR